MADSFDVTLDSLGRTYAIPTGGATDWGNGLTRYLRDSATVINSLSSGSIATQSFNVRNYGATGNGTTDDTVAIQAAMTALAALGVAGGALYFPAGTYKYTSRLQFGVASAQKNVKITGDGFSSVLKPTGSFSTNPTIEFRDCDYWCVQDLKIDATARTGSGDSVLVDGSSYGLLTNCTVIGSSQYGVNISQINGIGSGTGNTVTGNVYATNSTANVFVEAGLIGNVVNQNNGALSGPTFVDVAVRFGLKADGVTDETTVVQAALDWAYTEIVAGRLVALQFPEGDIVISSTIVPKGTSSAAPTLVGVAPYSAPAFDTAGTRFVWNGANNATMFYCQAFNKGMFQGITFLGNDKAGCGVHFAASTYADPAILAASSGWGMANCRVANMKVAVAGNACVKIGTDPALTGGSTFQSSEGVFRRCDFVGESTGAAGFTWAGLAVDGIKTMSGGNCKNFAAYDCTFNVCADAIDWNLASGSFLLENFNCANVRKGIRQSDGHLFVFSGDLECADVTDFQLLVGSGGGGDCNAELHGVEAVGFMSGVVGKAVEWAGALVLSNCYFVNSNQSVAPGTDNPFVVQISPALSEPGSITSLGNWYANPAVVTWAPIQDGSGNNLAPVPGVYGGENGVRVRSWGDKGGPNGFTPVPLSSFDSNPATLFSLAMNGRINYRGNTTITAHAGGGQGSAVALTAEVNFVTVVATGGDSVKLPTAALGLRVIVFNQGANSMDIFPAAGAQIDALGANNAHALAAGSSLEFYGKTTTAWFSR